MHKMNALLGRHFLEHFCKDTQYFVNRRQNKEKIKKSPRLGEDFLWSLKVY